MAEAFVTNIAKSLLWKLASFSAQEFCLAWGLEADLARLEEKLLAGIASLKSEFNLSEQTNDHSHVLHEETDMRQSFQGFFGLVGRDEDKAHIISLLAEPFEVDGAHPFVIPIVGMGGLGKTALAKTVSDESAHFDLKIQVCVADGFTLKQVMSKIIKSVTGDQSCNSLGDDELKEKLEAILNALPKFPNKLDRVRTVLFASDIGGPTCKADFEKRLIEFKHLRSLELIACFELFPKRIGALKHVRYLNVMMNSKLKRLPKSVFKLQNLQALFLGYGLEELPKDVRYMIRLRLLFLTTMQKRLPEGGIGCLECLQTLFIDRSKNLEYLCEDMQGLKSLRKLGIMQCKSLISLPRSLKYLTALEFLGIIDCEKLDLKTMEEEYEEEIKPLRLQTVIFAELPATLALPKQILQGSGNSLQTFLIEDCPKIREMPECVGYLNKLQQLAIRRCPSLSKRCQRGTGEDWPKIAHIPEIEVHYVDTDEETSD
ncbi:unnamed protein product [Dovyalis caffra]|uniref:NB-ARC domain-containing protein n=1 Tax=Dovyalis caffra TaxID=77055 RepID=A0AAV1RRX7_9ROSI|nr:unnamed protein product [Dovyalis caffra]